MSTRYRIFLSSVQKELAEERQALKTFILNDALLRQFFDVFLFEDIPASDRRPDNVYLEEVDRCDLYIRLFGDSYGSEGLEGISPTEEEFDRATKAAKPRIIFVKSESASGRHPKMQALIRKAGDQLIRRRFASIPELTAGVYASLVEYLGRWGAITTGPFDASACRGAALTDISEEKVATFLDRAVHARGYAHGRGTPMRSALVHLNLLDHDRPSNAAILLFGTQPQRFLLSSEVKCLHFHGTQVRKPIPSYQVYKGDLFQLVDAAIDFVMGKLNRAVGTRAVSNEAPVTYEIPRDAVAEAIVNGIAHRDYSSNASVQVMLFSDRLEVWNPGSLPPSLTIDSLRHPHASVPHNPLIAESLFLTRIVERAGSGILDMIELCAESGLRPPEFRQDAGSFIQTLWRPVQSSSTEERGATQSATQSATQPEIQAHLPMFRLTEVLEDHNLSAGQLREALEIKHRPTFRKNYIHPAMKAGYIELTIPEIPTSRLQKYRLTDAGRAWLAIAREGKKRSL
jgi:ATP-dependent DNA helicase RecG